MNKIARLEERLRKKGWTENEIERTLCILKYGKSNQRNIFNKRITQEGVYWIGLIVVIIGNMILSALLVPFFIVFQHASIYVFIILFALGFGYVFNFLLRDIEMVDPKHHIISYIFIPTMAIITIYIAVYLTNLFVSAYELNQEVYNPIMVGAAYVLAFMLPYLYSQTPNIVDYVERLL